MIKNVSTRIFSAIFRPTVLLHTLASICFSWPGATLYVPAAFKAFVLEPSLRAGIYMGTITILDWRESDMSKESVIKAGKSIILKIFLSKDDRFHEQR